jgi:hypothetical protein
VGELAGVSAVKADKDAKQVTVSWDPAATGWAAIEATMREINCERPVIPGYAG